MQVHIEKYGDFYAVRLTVTDTGSTLRLGLTEKEARLFASDLERCSQAMFAVLPEVDQ
jgi:hypothetical protein